MTVRSRARIGQPRSHAIAYLARAKACVSLSRASASGPFGWGGVAVQQTLRLYRQITLAQWRQRGIRQVTVSRRFLHNTNA